MVVVSLLDSASHLYRLFFAMFSYIHSFYALVATLILSNSILVAHAGHVRFHKHHLKAHQHLHPRIANAEQGHGVSSKANLLSRDTNSTNTTDVSQILSDTTAFAKWIDVWATSTNASNSASSIAQVQEEARTYGAKMQTWLQANTASTSSTVQRIQLYFTTLNQWMDNWVAQANSTDPVAAKNSLQADIQEYVSWMTTLIGNLNSSSATGTAILSAIPSAAPSAVESLPSHLATSSFADAQVSFPAAGATTTSFVTAFVTSTTTLVSTSIIQSSSPPASSGILSVVSSSASSSGGGQFVQLPSSSISDSQSSTVSTTLVTSATASLAATVAASSSVSPNAPGPSSGFNPKASDNVAVYFGQTAATGQVPLPQLCSDASINIVLLAFLNDYFSTSPTNFGPFTAEVLAPQVTACQQQGKIVLLSLGGAKEYSESTFTDDTEATAFAHTLWNGFGGGTAGGGSRPFGSVKFDGFDVGEPPFNRLAFRKINLTYIYR